LFKQLADNVMLDQSASHAFVRNKRELIAKSLDTIRQLESEQRDALDSHFTNHHVGEVDELEALIGEIVDEFQREVIAFNDAPLKQRERLRSLLEVTVEGRFRRLINSAVNRQGKVVASIESEANAFNAAFIWFAVALGVLSLLIILYASFWLFNQLYHPIYLIRNAVNAVASGEYDKPITEALDGEFEELSCSINKLAVRLNKYELQETESRVQLQDSVDQRTSELTKANLELTKIDARRRQFISDISHELRTPLTIIRGEAQIALRMRLASQEDYVETLSSISEQSINLNKLVDDLLFLTRAEMQQLEINLDSVNLAELIEVEVSRWQRHCPNRVFSFSSCEKLDRIEILIDKSRIQQVISILLDNSSKYSKIAGPIDIALTSQSGHVVITVNDHGNGISAAEVENVFERFVRFSRNHDGLGLGLPIAKAIIEAHGGKIAVESVQGEGSIFSIILPTESVL
jgi:signal transduction histidine kinase